MSQAPVNLRGHHLLCMLTYVGRGYTAEHTETFNQIAARIRDGAAIRIVRGPDDICQPMITPESNFHCRDADVGMRDVLAIQAVSKVLNRTVLPGTTLQLDRADMLALRTAFADKSSRKGCGGCNWENFCTEVADSGFENSKLLSDNSGAGADGLGCPETSVKTRRISFIPAGK